MSFFRICLVLACLACALSAPAQATNRLFSYSYQTGVLAPGQIEIEPWTTVRTGRGDYFRRLDQRLELEVGVAPGLQTAWYLNLSAEQAEKAGQTISSTLQGVSWEWKWQLQDPVADAVGLALYFEGGFARHETELEAKVLLDKRIGNLTLVANIVGEVEWERENGKSVQELILETDVAAAWHLSPAWAVGLESRSHTEFVDGEREHTAVFAGPAVSYAQERWWAAMTVMPQVPLGGHSDLHEHEQLEGRLLFGLRL